MTEKERSRLPGEDEAAPKDFATTTRGGTYDSTNRKRSDVGYTASEERRWRRSYGVPDPTDPELDRINASCFAAVDRAVKAGAA